MTKHDCIDMICNRFSKINLLPNYIRPLADYLQNPKCLASIHSGNSVIMTNQREVTFLQF